MGKKLIWAEDAILTIKTRQWLTEGAKEVLIHQLERLPSVQPEQRWMPVPEGTPKESFPCFVTVSCTNSWDEEYPDILPYFVAYDRESETWIDYDGDPCPFEIKAWMPLPKPWKGEKK